MKRMTFTGNSVANTAKTHALGTQSNTSWVDIQSLAVTTKGGDVAADVSIKIYDAGYLRWQAVLRDAKEWSKNFSDIGMLKMEGAMTIVTAAGGANVIVTTSCVYSCYSSVEEAAL